MLFNDIPIFISGGYNFSPLNLEEGIMWNISLNYFEFGLVVQMLFKEKNNLQLWRPFCSGEQNHLCNFGRGHYEKYFCEIILNLDQMLFKDISYLFCLAEWNHLCNFGRGHYEEHFC